MARHRRSVTPGFSWKRAAGITSAKRRIARKTGIPFTKAGRRNKLRRVGCGGCLVVVLPAIMLAIAVAVIIAGLL